MFSYSYDSKSVISSHLDFVFVTGDSGHKRYSYNLVQAHLSEGIAQLIKTNLTHSPADSPYLGEDHPWCNCPTQLWDVNGKLS